MGRGSLLAARVQKVWDFILQQRLGRGFLPFLLRLG